MYIFKYESTVTNCSTNIFEYPHACSTSDTDHWIFRCIRRESRWYELISPRQSNSFDLLLLGCIDFKEFICGISSICRGQQIERHKCKFPTLFPKGKVICFLSSSSLSCIRSWSRWSSRSIRHCSHVFLFD